MASHGWFLSGLVMWRASYCELFRNKEAESGPGGTALSVGCLSSLHEAQTHCYHKLGMVVKTHNSSTRLHREICGQPGLHEAVSKQPKLNFGGSWGEKRTSQCSFWNKKPIPQTSPPPKMGEEGEGSRIHRQALHAGSTTVCVCDLNMIQLGHSELH